MLSREKGLCGLTQEEIRFSSREGFVSAANELMQEPAKVTAYPESPRRELSDERVKAAALAPTVDAAETKKKKKKKTPPPPPTASLKPRRKNKKKDECRWRRKLKLHAAFCCRNQVKGCTYISDPN